ncbi:hypothetical protein IE077_003636, partial [Cardiosporidium cionae]
GPFSVLKEVMIALQISVWNPTDLLRMLHTKASDIRMSRYLDTVFPFLTSVKLLKEFGVILSDRSVMTVELAVQAYLTFSEKSTILVNNALIFESAIEKLFNEALTDVRNLSLLPILAICHRYSLRRWQTESDGFHAGGPESEVAPVILNLSNDNLKIQTIDFFLWPAYRISTFALPWKDLICAYIEILEVSSFLTITGLTEMHLRQLFTWLFHNWIANSDSNTSDDSFIKFFLSYEAKGDLPYFKTPSLLRNVPISDVKRQYVLAAVSVLLGFLKELEECALQVQRRFPPITGHAEWNEHVTQLLLDRRNELLNYESTIKISR